MNNQLRHYSNIEPDFFQEREEEIGVKITGEPAIFLRTTENCTDFRPYVPPAPLKGIDIS